LLFIANYVFYSKIVQLSFSWYTFQPMLIFSHLRFLVHCAMLSVTLVQILSKFVFTAAEYGHNKNKEPRTVRLVFPNHNSILLVTSIQATDRNQSGYSLNCAEILRSNE
jgi:hypothetical protein